MEDYAGHISSGAEVLGGDSVLQKFKQSSLVEERGGLACLKTIKAAPQEPIRVKASGYKRIGMIKEGDRTVHLQTFTGAEGAGWLVPSLVRHNTR